MSLTNLLREPAPADKSHDKDVLHKRRGIWHFTAHVTTETILSAQRTLGFSVPQHAWSPPTMACALGGFCITMLNFSLWPIQALRLAPTQRLVHGFAPLDIGCFRVFLALCRRFAAVSRSLPASKDEPRLGQPPGCYQTKCVEKYSS